MTDTKPLIEFLTKSEGYGQALPDYLQRCLWAAQALSNMVVTGDDVADRTTALFVAGIAKGYLEEVVTTLVEREER